MNFNQGFGSAQGFNSGQWPLSQNQQYQQQLGMQGPPQQFMQAWQNPLQNQQTLPPSSFGWHASPQHIQYHHTQDTHHARQSNTGDVMAQNQELQKKQQYEEQKRKLKEMSKRGPKSKQEDGKNMLDALISKADLGLSSSSSLGAVKKPTSKRQTNVFTGQSGQETSNQHPTVEGFSHPQSFLQTSNQSAPNFPQQTDIAGVEQNMKNFQQSQQQWQIQSHLQQQQQPPQQLLNFGANAGVNQNIIPQYEDDFGDFQGGSTGGIFEQTPGSLNSSTSSLSSLKSSFNSGFQHIAASNPETNSSCTVLPGMYTNTSPRLLAGAEIPPLSSLAHPHQVVSSSQHSDQPGGMTQKLVEGFDSSSEVPHFSYANSFQTSYTDTGNFTPVSAYNSGSVDAFSASSVPENAGQLLDSYAAGFVHKEQKAMLGQMNMIENPLPDGDGTPEESQIYGCQLPDWLHDPSFLPSVYRKVLSKSLSLDGSVDTAKVTDILLSSNIPKDKLRDIWEMANKKTPGVLIEEELYLILGLVALSQAGWTKLSVSKLSSCNTAPIPEFPEHILMEMPSGSVFGGDVLSIDDNSRSSSPIDPNDKYSVFRSHSKNAEPALTVSTVAANDAQTSSFGWSASITSLRSEGSETPAQFSDFQKADNSEAWADFQSSANVSEIKGIVNTGTGCLDSKQGLFQGGANTSEFLTAQPSRPISEAPTISMGFTKSEKSPPSTVEKNEDSSRLFGRIEYGSGTSDNFGFQIGSTGNAGTENYLTSGNLIGSSVSMNATDFHSGSPNFSEAKSVDIADFSKLDVGSNGPGIRTRILEQKKESSIASEFGDFHSINSHTVTADLFSSDSKTQIQHTPIANSASIQADLSASGHADSNPSGDDSWNEFASFAPVLDIPDSNQKALPDTDSKENDIFSAFSIPMEKKTHEVVKDDVNPALNSLSLLDESSKSDHNSVKKIAVVTNTSVTVDSDFSGFSFETPSQEAETKSKAISFSKTENIELEKGFSAATSQSEFASFASFDSSGTQESRIFENIGYSKVNEHIDETKTHATFRSRDALQPSVTTFGAFTSKEISIPDDLPAFSQSGSVSSNLDDFGGLSNDASNKQMAKSSNLQFAPSQGVLDISEQLSSFSLTTAKSAVPKTTSSFQLEAHSIASNSSLKKNSQSSDFVESTLDVGDRYKALTGVLEDSELHVNEWKRCLEGVEKVFESAASTMKKHSLSLSNKKEIFESEEGKQYFNGLKEILAVACRIKVSIENSAIAKSSDDLKNLLKSIERYWREICAFSSGLPEYAFPDAAAYPPPIDTTDASSPCGICLVDLNDKPLEWSNWKMSTACLAYGSKNYHSTCANFWCNKVNPVLPALSPLTAGLL